MHNCTSNFMIYSLWFSQAYKQHLECLSGACSAWLFWRLKAIISKVIPMIIFMIDKTCCTHRNDTCNTGYLRCDLFSSQCPKTHSFTWNSGFSSIGAQWVSNLDNFCVTKSTECGYHRQTLALNALLMLTSAFVDDFNSIELIAKLKRDVHRARCCDFKRNKTSKHKHIDNFDFSCRLRRCQFVKTLRRRREIVFFSITIIHVRFEKFHNFAIQIYAHVTHFAIWKRPAVMCSVTECKLLAQNVDFLSSCRKVLFAEEINRLLILLCVTKFKFVFVCVSINRCVQSGSIRFVRWTNFTNEMPKCHFYCASSILIGYI